MNRPSKLNAINSDLVHALTDALHAALVDNDIAVVILAGAGRAFSAGADTSTPRPLTVETRPNVIKHGDTNIALTKLLVGGAPEAEARCAGSPAAALHRRGSRTTAGRMAWGNRDLYN